MVIKFTCYRTEDSDFNLPRLQELVYKCLFYKIPYRVSWIQRIILTLNLDLDTSSKKEDCYCYTERALHIYVYRSKHMY